MLVEALGGWFAKRIKCLEKNLLLEIFERLRCLFNNLCRRIGESVRELAPN